MSEFHSMTDHALGAALTKLGDEVAWPAPPDVASAVGRQIREREKAPSSAPLRSSLSLPSRRRTVLILVAAFLTLAAAALAARLVIELGAVTVRVIPGTPTHVPTDVLRADDLGRQVTLSRAEAISGSDVALPAALGPPDRVWVDETAVDPESDAAATRIVTAWEPTARLPAIPGTDTGAMLMQFEGNWEAAAKQVYSETNRYGEATVNGGAAFWTSGPHELTLVTGDHARRVLVTGNIVIWQDGALTFRLETSLPKTRAIAIAETLGPSTP